MIIMVRKKGFFRIAGVLAAACVFAAAAFTGISAVRDRAVSSDVGASLSRRNSGAASRNREGYL